MSADTPPCLLVFGAGPWRGAEVVGSTRYFPWELARRGWRVVYVDPPRRLARRSRPWIATEANFAARAPRGVVPFAPRLAPANALGEVWRRLASRALAREGWLRTAERDCRPDVVWYGSPWHGIVRRETARIWEPLDPSAAHKAPPLHVFHVYDELADSPVLGRAAAARLRRWEGELLAECELTLCSSVPQLETRRGNARRAELLQNAVSDDFLAASESGTEPEAAKPFLKRLAAIPGPRLVYGGVVDLRLDGAWFRALVDALPDAHLVFLGYQEKGLDPAFERLLSGHPRVHVMGRVPYAAYPALYRMADVLLLAHRDMAFTRGMYPEKLNEYLASGRPIVSRELAEVRRLADESGRPSAIRLATTPEAWIAAIREALADRDASAVATRRETARRHTWSVEAGRLDALLREVRGLTPAPRD